MNTIDDYFKKINLKMDSNAKEVFLNHIRVLKNRINDNEQIDDIEDSLMNEVKDEAFEVTDEVINILGIEKEVITKSERFLLTTHIQVAMDHMEEEK